VLFNKSQFLAASIVFNILLGPSRCYNNVPSSIVKYPLLKRKLFVAAYNAETAAKTADVRLGAQIAKWNQNLDAL
jgi:hypothetical protein